MKLEVRSTLAGQSRNIYETIRNYICKDYQETMVYTVEDTEESWEFLGKKNNLQ